MNPGNVSGADLWLDVDAVRKRNPLVHSITNLVAMNFNANVLLAIGASPVMAHAEEEVEAMSSIAQALVVNIGTLDPRWVGSMKLATRAARRRGAPVVLDPVGAGATPYRNQAVAEILEAGPPNVIRGNASEILSTEGASAATRGVDSAASPEDATEAAHRLARRHDAVVCVSGADDHVIDATGRWIVLSNGHPWMTKVTGVGCSATAMVAAFCAVQPDHWRATAAAMALLGVVGDWAAERVQARGGGIGSYQVALLDGLFLLDEEAFLSRLRMAHRG